MSLFVSLSQPEELPNQVLYRLPISVLYQAIHFLGHVVLESLWNWATLEKRRLDVVAKFDLNLWSVEARNVTAKHFRKS